MKISLRWERNPLYAYFFSFMTKNETTPPTLRNQTRLWKVNCKYKVEFIPILIEFSMNNSIDLLDPSGMNPRPQPNKP